jgi:hypothetical protein
MSWDRVSTSTPLSSRQPREHSQQQRLIAVQLAAYRRRRWRGARSSARSLAHQPASIANASADVVATLLSAHMRPLIRSHSGIIHGFYRELGRPT